MVLIYKLYTIVGNGVQVDTESIWGLVLAEVLVTHGGSSHMFPAHKGWLCSDY